MGVLSPRKSDQGNDKVKRKNRAIPTRLCLTIVKKIENRIALLSNDSSDALMARQ